MTTSWDAQQYLKFENERTRPARDLLAQVPSTSPKRVYDLGCGPGNSTALLRERFPDAQVIGVDNLPEMLAKARQALPDLDFEEADLETWSAPDADLVFANAVFQWLPAHRDVLRRLTAALPSGGVLAVQMPDNLTEPTHRLMSEVGASGPWAERIAAAKAARDPLPPPGTYYDLLAPLCRSVDLWHTAYQHVMADAAAIVDWVMGTGLRPFLAPLDAVERALYLERYGAAIAAAYPPCGDGRILLRFPRFSSSPSGSDAVLRRRRLFLVGFAAALLAQGDRPRAEMRKLSRVEAAYQDGPKDGHKCAYCTLFAPPHACKIIDGDVSPNGWCNAFDMVD